MAEVKGVWILDYAKMIKNLLKVNPEKNLILINGSRKKTGEL